jgi:hypothetical protein
MDVKVLRRWALPLLLLLVIRFILIPLREWQSEINTSLDMNLQLQRKTELLSTQFSNSTEQKALIDKYDAEVAKHFLRQKDSDFRLAFQQNVQNVAAENQVTVELFDMLLIEPVLQSNQLKKAIVQLRLKGKAANVVATHAMVDSLSYVNVDSAKFVAVTPLEQTSELTVAIDMSVYFLSGEQIIE